MKLIIGVYDREVSHNLAIVLSSKKIAPIEAESMEEIPALLERHPDAMLLCEETSIDFYLKLQKKSPTTDIYLMYHPSLSTTELLKLKSFSIKSLIPYSENANEIIEVIIKQLSMLASSIKKNDQSFIIPNQTEHKDVAMHLGKAKKWVYGQLQGFNSSKVAVTIDDVDIQHALIDESESDNLMMYLQGLNIRMYADLIYNKQNTFVFRYRKMNQDDAQRLAYFIYYCQQQSSTNKMAINI